MTDRKFIKLNTSIQTASNSATLTELADGTIPATIELRLPDSIFQAENGSKTVDDVSMLTTKFRVSMSETPIIQIPLDSELSAIYGQHISSCKLGVYPFSILDDNTLKPTPSTTPRSLLAFPEYKYHEVNYTYRLFTDPDNSTETDTVFFVLNDLLNTFPTDSVYYQISKDNNLIQGNIYNIIVPDTHEVLKIEGNNVLIKQLSTLEQMLSDALENALTIDSTGFNQSYYIDLISKTYAVEHPDLFPKPNLDSVVTISDVDYCYWKRQLFVDLTYSEEKLSFAVKPRISFDESSFKLQYDTVSFKEQTPVLWNPRFINTYDVPEQLKLSDFIDTNAYRPPPKRVYRYATDIEATQDLNWDYQFSLLSSTDAFVYNILANQTTRDVLPFLPWIPFKPQEANVDAVAKPLYKYESDIYEKETVETRTVSFLSSFEGLDNPGNEYMCRLIRIPFASSNSTFSTTYTAGEDGRSNPVTVPQFISNALLTADFLSNKMAIIYYYCIPVGSEEYITTQDVFKVSPSYRRNNMFVIPTPLEYHTSNNNFQHEEMLTTVETTSNTSRTDVSVPPPVYTYDSSRYQLGNKTVTIEEEIVIDPNQITTAETTAEMLFYDHSRTQKIVEGVPSNVDDAYWIYQEETSAYSPLYEVLRVSLPPWEPEYKFINPYNIIQIDGNDYYECFVAWEIFDKSWPTPIFYDYAYHGQYNIYLSNNNTAATRNCRYRVTQIDTTTTTGRYKDETFTEISSSTSKPSIIYPNILNDLDETLYILNGTSAEMSMESPEPINDCSPLTYEVTEKTTSSTNVKTTTVETICYPDGTPLDTCEIRTVTANPFLLGTSYFCGLDHSWHIGDSSDPYYGKPLLVYACATEEGAQPYGTFILGESLAGPFTLGNDTIVVESGNGSWGPSITTSVTENPSTSTRTTTFDTSDAQYKKYLNNETVIEDVVNTYTDEQEDIVSRDRIYNFIVYDPTTHQNVSIPAIATTKPLPSHAWVDFPLICLGPDVDADTKYLCGQFKPDFANASLQPYISLQRIIAHYPYDYENFCDIWAAAYLLPAAGLFFTGRVNHLKTTVTTETTDETQVTVEATQEAMEIAFKGNVKLSYTWSNIPVVIMSPIQSFVMVLNGMQVTQEFQPVNIAEPTGSSLTSTIPIIENYYSLATTIRDLHDELVVSRESFEDAAVYKMSNTAGQERTIVLSVKYITKDGRLHQLYIPKNGVFTLQLTFGLSYYIS